MCIFSLLNICKIKRKQFAVCVKQDKTLTSAPDVLSQQIFGDIGARAESFDEWQYIPTAWVDQSEATSPCDPFHDGGGLVRYVISRPYSRNCLLALVSHRKFSGNRWKEQTFSDSALNRKTLCDVLFPVCSDLVALNWCHP